MQVSPFNYFRSTGVQVSVAHENYMRGSLTFGGRDPTM
jgi:hypothetical protein